MITMIVEERFRIMLQQKDPCLSGPPYNLINNKLETLFLEQHCLRIRQFELLFPGRQADSAQSSANFGTYKTRNVPVLDNTLIIYNLMHTLNFRV